MKKTIISFISRVGMAAALAAALLVMNPTATHAKDDLIIESVSPEESGFIQANALESFNEYILEKEAILNGAESGNSSDITIQSDAAGFKTYVAEQLKKRTKEIKVKSYSVLKQDVKALLADIVNANPDLYYVQGTYKFSYNKDGIVVSIFPEYTESDSDSDITYEGTIKEIIALTDDSMSDIEKALIVHDWMTLNVEYDYENYRKGTIPWDSYTAKGPLVNRIAVCNGYALAYEEVLKRLGISCKTVASNSMNHAWNMVKLNDNWYHVDTTWDDPVPDTKGYAGHSYFLVSDIGMTNANTAIRSTHSGWVSDVKGTDSQYDEAYWVNSDCEILRVDNGWLCVANEAVYRVDGKLTAEEKAIYTESDLSKASPRWGSLIFMGMAQYKGNIYVCDQKNIYLIDAEGKNALNRVYKNEEGSSYRGLYVKGGKFYASIYSSKGVILKEIDLDGGKDDDKKDDGNLLSISFIKSSFKLANGQKLILTPIMNPVNPKNTKAGRFTWKTSDMKIATVSDTGEVTPVSKGTCKITATNMDDTSIKASCEIIISDTINPEDNSNGFKVRFVDNSYELIEEKFVEEGAELIAPTAPEIPGYVFKSWDTVLSEIKANAVVQALYTPIEYTLSLNPDGGKLAEGLAEVYKFDVLTGKQILPVPKKSGYKFDGWYDSENNKYDYIKDGHIGSLSLRARWSELTDKEKWGDIASEDRAAFSDYTAVEDKFYVMGLADSYEFNGSAVTIDDLRVYFGKTRLTKGADYTVAYLNNKARGEASCKIKFKGNYKGIIEKSFKITDGKLDEAASISGNLVVTNCYEKADGSKKSPLPTVIFNGVILKKDRDYKVEYPDTAEGAYTNATEDGWAIRVTGIGDFDSRDVSGYPLYVESKLYMRSDDTVDISKAKVSGVKKASYDGKNKEQPDMLLTYSGSPLTKSSDYEVRYVNNINQGTAYAIISGKGKANGFMGDKVVSFKIGPAKSSDKIDLGSAGSALSVNVAKSVNYQKGGTKPEVSVSYNGIELKKGVDYILGYKNINSETKDASKPATVTIKGKGLYKGNVEKTFTITKQDFNNVTLCVSNRLYSEKGGMNTTAVSIYDVNGKKLAAGKDYDKNIKFAYTETVKVKDEKGNELTRHTGEKIGKTDVIPVGTKLRAYVKGCGNYTDDTISAYYYVKSKSISKAIVTFAKKVYEYSGSEICPGKSDISIAVGDSLLKDQDYEILGYYNNIALGKGTIIIKGRGDYAGIKVVSFKIGAREVKN